MKVVLALQLMRTAMTEINRPVWEVSLSHINACSRHYQLSTREFGVRGTQRQVLAKPGG
jgi:hypothetical protein